MGVLWHPNDISRLEWRESAPWSERSNFRKVGFGAIIRKDLPCDTRVLQSYFLFTDSFYYYYRLCIVKMTQPASLFTNFHFFLAKVMYFSKISVLFISMTMIVYVQTTLHCQELQALQGARNRNRVTYKLTEKDGIIGQKATSQLLRVATL